MEKMEQALADIRAAGGSKAIPHFNNSEALLRELRGLLGACREKRVRRSGRQHGSGQSARGQHGRGI